MPHSVITTLGRLRQEDYRFEVRIGETLSQNNKQLFPKKYKKTQNDDSIELTNQMNADDNNLVHQQRREGKDEVLECEGRRLTFLLGRISM